MTKRLPKGAILTDDIAENPILDFDRFSSAISNMIRKSTPKFSIGIYGEWGSGKTTLLKLIEKDLQDDNILTVWFNAWRYEREEHIAIIPLLKTIAYAMGEHKIYKGLRPIILRGLGILGKDFARQIASNLISKHGIEELQERLIPKMDLISAVDQDTLYFDGLKKIETEMSKISKKHPNSRVVVFIDDLDRCSPKRALEVLESIKVFLDVLGFVYVIGLSHATISKLLSHEFQEIGLDGDQYIQKIIQIPITIPEWKPSDIKELASELSGHLSAEYSDLLDQNLDVINTAVELNPRALKRFINNFMISYEIYSVNELEPRKLLLIQAMKVRWPDFYRFFEDIPNLQKIAPILIKYADLKDHQRDNAMLEVEKEGSEDDFERSLIKFKDPSLYGFFRNNLDDILAIGDLEVYRRAVKAVTPETTRRLSISGLSVEIGYMDGLMHGGDEALGKDSKASDQDIVDIVSRIKENVLSSIQRISSRSTARFPGLRRELILYGSDIGSLIDELQEIPPDQRERMAEVSGRMVKRTTRMVSIARTIIEKTQY